VQSVESPLLPARGLGGFCGFPLPLELVYERSTFLLRTNDRIVTILASLVMLDLLASGLATEWLQNNSILPKNADPVPLVSTWQGLPLLNPPIALEPQIQQATAAYLQTLQGMGLDPSKQGIWVQTDSINLLSHQTSQPLPAASLTKSATTLAAIKTWGIYKRFDTSIGMTGTLDKATGTINGDLVVRGDGDPFFVWEDAQALAYSLNQIGIQRVTGNLLIMGNFAMNYQRNPQKAGELLKQGLSGATLAQSLTGEQLKDVNVIKAQTSKLAALGKFQVAIGGPVLLTATSPTPIQPLIRHRSLPLQDILREMNIYSNNEIAQMLADSVGGHEKVMSIAAAQAGFPLAEIQLVNGSGLGVQNQIAPHGASQILRAIQGQAQAQGLTLADFFPSFGLDTKGSMLDRRMPQGTTVKTGTLNEVSALSGVLPTRRRGLVWFTIINRGSQIAQLRQQQDKLLQTWQAVWGIPNSAPLAIARRNLIPSELGDPQRNEILVKLIK
jgi:serine-type D-Ala-D-Ala carboxypeptidase/endopeptidase (penicillin-binding protein 4)